VDLPAWLVIHGGSRQSAGDRVRDQENQPPRQAQGQRGERDHEGPSHEIEHGTPPYRDAPAGD
jgi:hypothetical protein